MGIEYINPIIDILGGEETPPEWLVPNIFAQGSLVVLAGEPGAGKSYLSYMVGLAIASGVEALGGLIPAGPPRRVLYFDEENSKQDRDKYLRRAYQGLRAKDGSYPDLVTLHDHFFPVHMQLGHEDWAATAEEYIMMLSPHCIVIDTATPAFDIKDENNNAEATEAIKALRTLMGLTTPEATAIVLKHAKTRSEKGGRRMIRGAKAWQSAADGVMFQVKAAGRPRKDGLSLTRLEPDKTRAYGLNRVIFITPRWADKDRNGLVLDGSFDPSIEHRNRLDEEQDGEEG